jgi:hypothetical protein
MIRSRPFSAAIAGLLLALPFAVMITLLVLGKEPPMGPLQPLVTAPPDQPNVVGTAIVLGALLASLAGLIITLAPLLGRAQGGETIRSHPANVLIGVIISFFILFFVGSIVVDQYPCWVGVPNCD